MLRRQRCDQNTRWNNLRFLHGTATTRFTRPFPFVRGVVWAQTDFTCMHTVHVQRMMKVTVQTPPLISYYRLCTSAVRRFTPRCIPQKVSRIDRPLSLVSSNPLSCVSRHTQFLNSIRKTTDLQILKKRGITLNVVLHLNHVHLSRRNDLLNKVEFLIKKW